MAARYWFLGFLAAALFACGHNSGGNTDANGGGGDDGGGNTDPDAFEAVIDAPPFGGTCTPTTGAPQCSDCVDNDADGKIDGFDPECSGPLDRLEDSFATGIPGDNMDATYQDCFFDGDSGGGNDGCSQHVCCLLQAGGATTSPSDDVSECMKLAPQSNYSKYDRSKCYAPFGTVAVPSKCSMNCGPLAPPGCDCFGCCTVCNTSGCADIAINPAVSPNCTDANINDPGADGVVGTADDPCKRCTKNDQCGGSTTCGGATCVLCPGQDPSTLPSSCGGSSACPSGYTACDVANNNACPAGTYCQTGCCVGILL